MITETDLLETERLAKAATPGPWFLLGRPWQPADTCDLAIIAGNPDPHKGYLVADCDLDCDWTDDETDPRIKESANANFIARMHPKRVLEMVAAIRELEAELGKPDGIQSLKNRITMYLAQLGEREKELQRANEEIARLTKVNESHCRMWNESEDDLKRTRGLLETAENALRYIVSRGYTGAEFVAREALEKIRASRGES